MISRSLLLSKMFHDNPSLTATFHRIHTLKVINDKDYFPVRSARRLAQRFPSLSRVELRVYSFDSCVAIVDILLGSLAQLAFLKVHFERDTLLDDPFTRRYAVETKPSLTCGRGSARLPYRFGYFRICCCRKRYRGTRESTRWIDVGRPSPTVTYHCATIEMPRDIECVG